MFVDDWDQAFLDLDSDNAFCSELCSKDSPNAGSGTDIEKIGITRDVLFYSLVKQLITNAVGKHQLVVNEYAGEPGGKLLILFLFFHFNVVKLTVTAKR